MEESYDVTESLLSAKADEGMIAFAGFTVPEADGSVHEGLLKIAALTRPDGNGYLTLTFMLDLDAGSGQEGASRTRFAHADQETLAARLGADFEMLLEMPLNTFAESSRFYIEEMNLYFRRLAGRERRLLEERVIPVLSELLEIRVEPLEWAEEETPDTTARAATAPSQTLNQRLQQRIGARSR